MTQNQTAPAATLEDLQGTPGKAELIGGRIIRYDSSGEQPSRIAGRIFRSIAEYADTSGKGEAFTGNLGYAIPELQSGRKSFSPDVSYYDGPRLESMRFVEGPPTFAVEVRSENDNKPGAEAAIQAKRTDYFQAGAQVVWDVDTLAECIHVYRATAPSVRVTYTIGLQADAEPALPGWSVAVGWIFAGVVK